MMAAFSQRLAPMKPSILRVVAGCACLWVLAAAPALARVERIEVLSRTDVLDGHSFGAVGFRAALKCDLTYMGPVQ